jgi:hypothetical protein
MGNYSENITGLSLDQNDSSFLSGSSTETGISIQELYDYIYPQTLEWILIVTYALTFVVGNILVCFAVWINKDLRTITNIFMVNLSIADLLIIIFCLPSALLVDVTATWFLGTIACKIHVFLALSELLFNILIIKISMLLAICGNRVLPFQDINSSIFHCNSNKIVKHFNLFYSMFYIDF